MRALATNPRHRSGAWLTCPPIPTPTTTLAGSPAADRPPGRHVGGRRPVVHRAAGPGDRVPGPERGREVDDHAPDPGPRCADLGVGDRQRPPLHRLPPPAL